LQSLDLLYPVCCGSRLEKAQIRYTFGPKRDHQHTTGCVTARLTRNFQLVLSMAFLSVFADSTALLFCASLASGLRKSKFPMQRYSLPANHTLHDRATARSAGCTAYLEILL